MLVTVKKTEKQRSSSKSPIKENPWGKIDLLSEDAQIPEIDHVMQRLRCMNEIAIM